MNLKFVIIFIGLLSVNGEFSDYFSHIRPKTSAEEQQQNAAFNVIRRLVGNLSQFVQIHVDFKLPQHYFKLSKSIKSDVVHITASSGVAACKGFHHYLKYYCKCHISWDGVQLQNLKKGFPNVEFSMQSSSKIIYYQNVCTHSYSFTWWNEDDWRKHIDWIALSGITLTLAPFQEDIWSEIYEEFGMNRTAVDEDLAGPGFFAWQRMGNLRGWGGPLSRNFKTRASRTQQYMIEELNNLGISVALPAFDGHLPIQFKHLFPLANLSVVERWNGFPDKYCCPLFLDPTDPLFKFIGERFVEKIVGRYGTNHIYFSDPFNEVQPRLAEPDYLANVSKAIYAAMSNFDSNAIWLLQGWMFVKNPFWKDDMMHAFLTAVPKGKILVLDLQSEQHPQYNRTKSFYGQPFIWCMLHNFGGTLGMHGSIPILNKEIPSAYRMENSSMVGVGITPEGIHQNYVVYEFALEKSWKFKEINQKRWVKYYSQLRYGVKSANLNTAWLMLLRSVYSFSGQENIRGKYTYCRRPSLRITPWRWYDTKLIKKSLTKFITEMNNSTLRNNLLFTHDLVDLFRQNFQNLADDLYLDIIKKYREKDLQGFSEKSNLFLNLLIDLDKLLGSHKDFLLGSHLKAAIETASNQAEKQQYEFNLRNQITLWGPKGQILDYATKQWSGIVRDYYHPRWQLFFSELTKCLMNNTKFNQTAFQVMVFRDVELKFNYDVKTYPKRPMGDPIVVAETLYDKWQKYL